MKVLSAASEIYPLVKTGGLADVTGALPAALKSQGVEMRSMVWLSGGDGGAGGRYRAAPLCRSLRR